MDTADEDAAVVATAPEGSCMADTADRVAGVVEKQANREDHRLKVFVDVSYVSCPAEVVVSPASAAILVLENYVAQGLVHSPYVVDMAQEVAVSGCVDFDLVAHD